MQFFHGFQGSEFRCSDLFEPSPNPVSLSLSVCLSFLSFWWNLYKLPEMIIKTHFKTSKQTPLIQLLEFQELTLRITLCLFSCICCSLSLLFLFLFGLGLFVLHVLYWPLLSSPTLYPCFSLAEESSSLLECTIWALHMCDSIGWTLLQGPIIQSGLSFKT